MKDIIIAGASRSGKSTLARMINERYGHYVISIDKLVAVFGQAYPELDIRLNWNRDKTSENIASFLGHYLGMFSSPDGKGKLSYSHGEIPGNRSVLEGAYMDLDKISDILRTYGIEDMRDRFCLIGLVQCKKDADAFIRDFRQFDTDKDWTYSLTDDELKDVAEDMVAFNKEMYDKLTSHGFTIYDTSEDRASVLESILSGIESEMRYIE